MSAWMEILRQACQSSSQKAVAAKIGYSAATLSQVLSGTYKGDLNRVQAAIEGALMQSSVDCPVLEMIPRHVCIKHQRVTSPSTANPMGVRLWRACQHCPHNMGREPT